MSPHEIREKLIQFRSRNRIFNAALVLIFVVIGVFYFLQATDTRELIPQIGYALISVGNLYLSYLGIKTIRSVRAPGLPPDAELKTSAQLYEDTLEAALGQTRKRRRSALQAAVPIVMGVVLTVTSSASTSIHATTLEEKIALLIRNAGVPRPLVAWLPFLILLASWVFLRFYARTLSTGWLTSEITRLRRIER